MTITAIILTLNEQIHLERCIRSLLPLTSSIVVVDSGSTDDTIAIARKFNAQVWTHEWRNHATQFNWALTQIHPETAWILRIDADEVLSPELAEHLLATLPSLSPDVAGVLVDRRIAFMGRPIRFGGLFPTRVLRVFRFGAGVCEERWMDEHIAVTGKCVRGKGEILDNSLQSLTWWIAKHNSYSSREALELLNAEYAFIGRESRREHAIQHEAAVKRWVKENVYRRIPLGARALLYFMYRYVIRLGFLDGKEGAAFHFLQGFWYRFLVDCKVFEVKRHMRKHQCDATTAVREVLNIDAN